MKIAAASGKGGTGKTTLSTNLAAFLAERGSGFSFPAERIVLTDLDVEEPNSGLFIRGELVHEEDRYKMIPSWKQNPCTLCGLCQEVCSFNAVIKLGDQIMVFPQLCHSCYACSELCPVDALPMIPEKMGVLRQFQAEGFTFVESKLDIGQEQAVPLISQTIEYADNNFPDADIMLYDSPPGTSCPVIEAVKNADYVILVTEPTPFGLHDLKLAVETMRELKKPFGVVINRHGIGNAGVESYCREEGIDIIARIPNDRLAAELYSRGELLYRKIPAVERAMQSIAGKIGEMSKISEISSEKGFSGTDKNAGTETEADKEGPA
jgi:MinD superfamily P-loop ATPase